MMKQPMLPKPLSPIQAKLTPTSGGAAPVRNFRSGGHMGYQPANWGDMNPTGGITQRLMRMQRMQRSMQVPERRMNRAMDRAAISGASADADLDQMEQMEQELMEIRARLANNVQPIEEPEPLPLGDFDLEEEEDDDDLPRYDYPRSYP